MNEKLKNLPIILVFAVLFRDSALAQSKFTYRKPIFKATNFGACAVHSLTEGEMCGYESVR